MNASAAQRAATEQAPTCFTKNEAPQRGNEDTLIAAYRLRALGCSEQAAVLILASLADQGVRRVGRFVRRMPAEKVRSLIIKFEADTAEVASRRPRGDLLIIRSDPRWPWRTST